MTRGYSLEENLRSLIDNEKYSDIEILCENEKKLHGSRAILAARSEVFNILLYNGMKENQISFSNINSSVMKIVLGYIYTGSIKKESLNKNNIVEIFYAAGHFQLSSLQEFILATIKNADYLKSYSPELLSKVVDKMPEDNILLNLLEETVSIIPLDTIEHGRLSIKALHHLLSCTYKKEKPFITPEYEVFRHSAILAAKQVSNDAYEALMRRLPALEQVGNSNQVQNSNSITDHQKVANELEPLTHFIDFSQIESQILSNIIEPLEITPSNMIVSVYRQIAKSNNLCPSGVRGISMYKFTESDYVWDESACGSRLIVEDNGRVVHAPHSGGHQSVRAKMPLDYKGIFEWSVIIEKHCFDTWVGVCASENLNYESWAGCQPTGWVLGTYGKFKNSDKGTNYCLQFRKDNTKVTVHLNMYKKTCAFSIDDTKYKEISVKDLPSKLYPVVSLSHLGRLRILPYQK